MKIILENWKRFLKEQDNEYIPVPADTLGPYLYRISKRYGKDGSDFLKKFKDRERVIMSSTKAQDRDQEYRNEAGEIENRIYFFKNEDDARIVLMSRVEEIESIIGDISLEDLERGINNSILMMKIPTSSIPSDVQFYEDPEPGPGSYSAIYGVKTDGSRWEISPSPKNVMTASQLVKQLEDEGVQDSLMH